MTCWRSLSRFRLVSAFGFAASRLPRQARTTTGEWHGCKTAESNNSGTHNNNDNNDNSNINSHTIQYIVILLVLIILMVIILAILVLKFIIRIACFSGRGAGGGTVALMRLWHTRLTRQSDCQSLLHQPKTTGISSPQESYYYCYHYHHYYDHY